MGSQTESIRIQPQGITVIMVVGVNGVGKTTTIGKLAHSFRQEGKKVMLAAGDTFRAAAAEQLGIWAERTGLPSLSTRKGQIRLRFLMTPFRRPDPAAWMFFDRYGGRLHSRKT